MLSTQETSSRLRVVNSDISVCVIGSGAIGSLHIENLRIFGISNIIIVDPFYNSLPSLQEVDLATVDAVLVCTPTHTHAEIIQTINATHPKLPILCEKPFSYSTLSTEKVLQMTNDTVSVAFVERFSQPFQQVFSWYKKQHSPVNMSFTRRARRPISGHWMLDKSLAGSDILLDLGIHDIDAVIHMTQVLPVALKNHTHNSLTERLTLEFANKDEATLSIGWDIPDSHPFGVENTITMQSDNSSLVYNSNTDTLIIDNVKKQVLPRFEHAYSAELKAFLNHDTTNFPSNTELLLTMRCAEMIQNERNHA
jgi:predicted dehydrogenase